MIVWSWKNAACAPRDSPHRRQRARSVRSALPLGNRKRLLLFAAGGLAMDALALAVGWQCRGIRAIEWSGSEARRRCVRPRR